MPTTISAEVKALIDQGQAWEDQGEMARAWEYTQRALQLARDIDDRQGQALAHLQIAHILFWQGRFTEAIEAAHRALALAAPETPEIVRAWTILGNCAVEQDNLEQAEEHYRRALDFARLFGTPAQRMVCLHNLANGIYYYHGNFELALSHELEAYTLAKKYDLKGRLYLSYITLARTYLATGQSEQARSLIAEWLAGKGSSSGEPASAADSGYRLLLSADLALADGNPEEAAALYQQSLSYAEMYGEPGWKLDIYLGQSRCRLVMQDFPGAYAWAAQALKEAQKIGSADTHGRALLNRAQVAWQEPNAAAAQADLEESLRQLDRAGSRFAAAQANLLLAAAYQHTGLEQADAAFLEAAGRILAGGYLFLLDMERTTALPLIAQHLDNPNPNAAAAADKLLKALATFPPAALRVRTLGKYTVRLGTRTLEYRHLRARRAGELLALLLISPNHSLTNEQVIEAMTPEGSPESGQALVYKAASELRRLLEPWLTDRRFPARYLDLSDNRLTLHLPPASRLDFQDFQVAVKGREWEKAAAIYSGELLPEFRYAAWAVALREELTQDYQAALLHLAEKCALTEQWPLALEHARKLLALDPWNEPAALVAMQACQGLGNLSGALRIYQTLEKVLHDELDLEPGEALRQFYLALKKRQ